LDRGGQKFEERLRDKTAKLMQHQPRALHEEVARELEVMASHWQ
jgi:hypothetical protein